MIKSKKGQELFNEHLEKISEILNLPKEKIEYIKDSNSMTNANIVISAENEMYIVRIPGRNTESYIDRAKEVLIHNYLIDKKYDDLTIYIDALGFKISKFITDARVCDVDNDEDLQETMDALKYFHEKKFLPKVAIFNIFEEIKNYKSLIPNIETLVPEEYSHIYETCEYLNNVIDLIPKEKYLAHIDFANINVLLSKKYTSTLIDFEYAAIQDPHIDIASFAIFSEFDIDKTDKLINMYFKNEPVSNLIRVKIYIYIALMGFNWYHWGIYKEFSGQDLGDYTKNQFELVKTYIKHSFDLLHQIT